MATAASKKTYYPAKTFDDDLTALANLFQEKKWTFSGVDVSQLQGDAAAQRSERSEHDAVESRYFNPNASVEPSCGHLPLPGVPPAWLAPRTRTPWGRGRNLLVDDRTKLQCSSVDASHPVQEPCKVLAPTAYQAQP